MKPAVPFGRNGGWPQHIPKADPCPKCGERAAYHRNIRHKVVLDDSGHCIRCGLPESHHRTNQSDKRGPRVRRKERDRRTIHEPIVFLDGEGVGRFPHRYTYLAAVNEENELIGEIEHAGGLSTYSVLEFLLGLEVKRVFGFSIHYDLTKWLHDMPDHQIYDLVRPERRKGIGKRKGRPYLRKIYLGFNATTNKPGFELNYLRAKVTVRRAKWNGRHYQGFGPILTIWDIWRFFACKFTTALTDWQVADKAKLQRMLAMKEQRGEFDRLSSNEIRDYCKEECLYGAKLVRSLIQAHEDVGLRLKSFYGAGSTATALLNVMNVRAYKADPPKELEHAIACAFFGGRFETSRVGPIYDKVYNYDISSAYPYQTTFLPCLSCGRWERLGNHADTAIESASLALLYVKSNSERKWGAFPHRMRDGTITFPLRNSGVWVWKREYLAARRFCDVKLLDGWVYRTECDHKPFGALPDYYLERLRLGKDAKGIVLKLGYNSCYGKCAQSVGEAPFQSWVWAGNITAGTRGQLLDAMAAASNPWSVLMTATDGIFSLERLQLPEPIDTGTGRGGKPLGGWEEKVYANGIFLLRPGIYFPLFPKPDELKDVRARGMSKAVLLENADKILDHWRKHGPKRDFQVLGLQRFIGIRTGVQVYTEKEGPRRSRDKNGRVTYGEWIDYPIDLSFNPAPKRERILKDMRLAPWKTMRVPSAPYKKGKLSKDAIALKEAEEILSDQENGDFTNLIGM